MAFTDDYDLAEREGGGAMSTQMDETEIAAVLRSEIEDAIGYDDSEYEQDRVTALQYYRGIMADTPAEEGRSSVVSYDVADTIGEIMPSLMRVFFAGDKLVDYEPEMPGDEQTAEQATDYINYELIKHCDAYNVLWDSFHDALLHRNGILHYYWDATPEHSTHRYRGLSEGQLAALAGDDEVQILQSTPRQEQMLDEQGQPIPVTLYDLKIRRVKTSGRLKLCAIPPEEFLINSEATSIADARFVCWRTLVSRSSLVERGFDADTVAALSTYSDLESTETQQARFENEYVFGTTQGLDESQQEVQIYDCYVRIDVNRDGVGEWMHVVLGGDATADNILLMEEWDEEVPFTDLTPERVPHRWQGRSIYDEVHDIQRIKTVVLRHTLDSCYISNNPDEFVNENALVDSDEFLSREIGRRIRVKGNPNEVIANHQIPFIGNHTFPMMEYLDGMVEKRTGISRQTAALDAEALQNQSATAANLAASAAYSKVELIARNFAEQLRRAFRAMLRLVVENADRTVMIRLRDNFVEMDPRSWNADMDCTVDIGLGTGSRDRDMAMLQVIAMEQDKILDNLGPGNPFCTLDQRMRTNRKIVEAGGMKSPEMFFGEPDEQTVQQFMEQQAQQQQQPDPTEMAKLQAQGQLEEMKAQAAERKEMAQLQADIQTRRADLEKETIMAEREAQLKREEAERQDNLEREKLAFDAAVKERELMLKESDILLKYGAEQLPGGNLVFSNTGAIQGVMDALTVLSQQVDQMREASMRPRRIVRDENGRVAGVE